jgi:carbamoyltransferase
VATCSTQLIPVMLYDRIRLELTPETKPSGRILARPAPGFFDKYKHQYYDTAYHYYLESLSSPPDEELLFVEQNFPVAARANFYRLADRGLTPRIATRLHTVDHTLTIGSRRIPGMHVSHHLCHAYYGYSQLGASTAAILTFDGAAPSPSFQSGGLYFAEGGIVFPIHYHSFFFGSFYENLSQALGLGPIEAAGKLMGLAAWGHPAYYQPELVGSPIRAIRFLLGENGPRQYRARAMVRRWLARHGLLLQQFDLRDCDRPPEIAADIAASAQAMFTDAVTNLVTAASRIAEVAQFDFDALVLSGGCALNCPANSAVFRKGGTRIFVPPAVNDEGNSAGAALCCASLQGDAISFGTRLSPAEIAYKGVDHRALPRIGDYSDVQRLAVENPAEFLAERIAEGAIVGIFEGKAEIGPRALGHRSLIASPLDAKNWSRVNLIKEREPWRPLAPVVLDQDFHTHFDGCPDDSFYMLFNANVKTDHLPAVTHRDRTARVQVAVEECGFIYRLLLAFRALTGIGVLLNTSFNGRGEPIVETPADALKAFATMNLGYLYLQGMVLRKR